MGVQLEGDVESMTKQIRIENADAGLHYKVRVFEETQSADGQWVRAEKPVALDYPTAMHSGYIHRGKRLVIEETEA